MLQRPRLGVGQSFGEPQQSEPEIIRKWFDNHIRHRRARNAADIERGKASGELLPQTDPELVIDSIFGAIYYRLPRYFAD